MSKGIEAYSKIKASWILSRDKEYYKGAVLKGHKVSGQPPFVGQVSIPAPTGGGEESRPTAY